MLVQEKLLLILNQPKRSMQDFIQHCEAEGMNLLFNQTKTGHISGVTFFIDGFKAQGQALGSRFKWMEIVKQLDYEQIETAKALAKLTAEQKANTETSQQLETAPKETEEDTMLNLLFIMQQNSTRSGKFLTQIAATQDKILQRMNEMEARALKQEYRLKHVRAMVLALIPIIGAMLVKVFKYRMMRTMH